MGGPFLERCTRGDGVYTACNGETAVVHGPGIPRRSKSVSTPYQGVSSGGSSWVEVFQDLHNDECDQGEDRAEDPAASEACEQHVVQGEESFEEERSVL